MLRRFAPGLSAQMWPPVRLDEVPGDGELEAAPTACPAERLVHAVEALKDGGQVFGRDAHARILNGNEDTPPFAPRSSANLTS
jgi:hypothetical protein